MDLPGYLGDYRVEWKLLSRAPGPTHWLASVVNLRKIPGRADVTDTWRVEFSLCVKSWKTGSEGRQVPAERRDSRPNCPASSLGAAERGGDLRPRLLLETNDVPTCVLAERTCTLV